MDIKLCVEQRGAPYMLVFEMASHEKNGSTFDLMVNTHGEPSMSTMLWLHLTPDDLEKLHAALHQEVTL